MNIFQGLEQEESLWLIAFHVGAFLIGILTGWLIWGLRARKARKDLAAQMAENNNLERTNKELIANSEIQAADNKKLLLETNTYKSNITSLEQQKGDLHGELFKLKESETLLKEQIDDLQRELSVANDNYNQAYLKSEQLSLQSSSSEESVDELKEIIDALTKEKAALAEALDSAKLAVAADGHGNDGDMLNRLKERIVALEEDNDRLNLELEQALVASRGVGDEHTEMLKTKVNELNVLHEEKATTLAEKESKIQELHSSTSEIQLRKEVEVSDLKTQIAALQESLNHAQTSISALENDLEAKETMTNRLMVKIAKIKATGDESIADDIDIPVARGVEAAVETPMDSTPALDGASAVAAIKGMLGSRIPKASSSERDDLKVMNGIGGFIEKKLNAIGIYNFEQISKWDAEIIEIVTAAIGYFPGRIERDDWVGQAQAMLEE